MRIPDTHQYTILIVDDSETDRFTYERYINQAKLGQCTVKSCETGEEGLAHCHEQLPDLVLLDYMLPDLDGLEFLEMLQECMAAMPPVIMLTGEGNEAIAVKAMKTGALDYIVKGEITSERLSFAIRRVLNQRIFEQLLNRQQRQQRLMAEIALRISRTSEIKDILDTAAEGMRQILDCDRTIIYRFSPDMSGTIVAESVLPEWTASFGVTIEDTCLSSGDVTQSYLEGHKTVISDIHDSHLSPCHIQMLDRFQIKANLVVPIVLREPETQKKKLWGLLLANHCRSTRSWQSDELVVLDNLAVQLAIALYQAELVATLKSRAKAVSSANKRLFQTARLLKSRNQELDKFASIASHDLRAPLRAISNLAGWLDEDLDGTIPAENQQQLNLIQSRAKRLDDFIIALLQYSRAGRSGLETTVVDSQALISEIISDLAPAPTFRFTVAESMPVLHTEKVLLQQVLANLIGNAIKYHDREDGVITITAEDQSGKVLFSVTDDGPGIEPAYHEKIFEIFETLVSRDISESTGVGLSIVKKVIEQQGGDIVVTSAVGEGSTFSFTWPKVSPSES